MRTCGIDGVVSRFDRALSESDRIRFWRAGAFAGYDGVLLRGYRVCLGSDYGLSRRDRAAVRCGQTLVRRDRAGIEISLDHDGGDRAVWSGLDSISCYGRRSLADPKAPRPMD